jgi:hypothetical protein
LLCPPFAEKLPGRLDVADEAGEYGAGDALLDTDPEAKWRTLSGRGTGVFFACDAPGFRRMRAAALGVGVFVAGEPLEGDW